MAERWWRIEAGAADWRGREGGRGDVDGGDGWWRAEGGGEEGRGGGGDGVGDGEA